MLSGFLLARLTRDRDKLIAPLTETNMVRLFPIALRQLTFTYASLLLSPTKDLAISRLFLGCHALTFYATLLWSNAMLPQWFARSLFRGTRESATLLVGPASRLTQLQSWVARKASFGIRIIGLVRTDTASKPAQSAIPILG